LLPAVLLLPLCLCAGQPCPGVDQGQQKLQPVAHLFGRRPSLLALLSHLSHQHHQCLDVCGLRVREGRHVLLTQALLQRCQLLRRVQPWQLLLVG
jgi:hypothetical protein